MHSPSNERHLLLWGVLQAVTFTVITSYAWTGELSVDQAHRGYSGATDESGFGSINPLFWKPTRDAVTGRFNGQQCYGYRSFEAFVDACIACNGGKASPRDFEDILPTLSTTLTTTAILEVCA